MMLEYGNLIEETLWRALKINGLEALPDQDDLLLRLKEQMEARSGEPFDILVWRKSLFQTLALSQPTDEVRSLLIADDFGKQNDRVIYFDAKDFQQL
jgi:hypothetical protein